jgi:hypothetical protein
MSQTPQLPIWVSYLQALAIPIVGVGVAAAGGLIAWAQMVIARDRFEIDAFDRQYVRRVAVYESTRQFLEGAIRGTLSESDIRAYGLRTLDAQFLFDDGMYMYLRELCWRVTTWIDAKSSIEKLPPGEDREVQERIRAEQLDWIIKQGDESSGFATKFRPFLVYERRKPPRLLRLLKL